VARGLSVAAGVLGLPLSGYSAVLLANTAVPVWQATRRTLPWLFMSSGVASAGSLLELLPLKGQEQRVVRVYGTLGKVAELAAGVAVQREASRMEVLGRPLKHGVAGTWWKASKACVEASLVLGLWPRKARWARVAGALLGTAGSLAMRYAMFRAGKASASDPQATFQPQRQGLGAAEVTKHTHASDGRPLKVPLPVWQEPARIPVRSTPQIPEERVEQGEPEPPLHP
jgi:hypothetical protein